MDYKAVASELAVLKDNKALLETVIEEKEAILKEAFSSGVITEEDFDETGIKPEERRNGYTDEFIAFLKKEGLNGYITLEVKEKIPVSKVDELAMLGIVSKETIAEYEKPKTISFRRVRG